MEKNVMQTNIMQTNRTQTKGLNSNQLKMIAIIAMTIDHR